jgi:hypothetical protein
MEYVYIGMKGDREIITDKVKGFESCNNDSLIADYNKQSKCGITGVRGQALYLMAMGHVFFKRFGKSPIYMENNVLGIKGQIKIVWDTFEYVR